MIKTQNYTAFRFEHGKYGTGPFRVDHMAVRCGSSILATHQKMPGLEREFANAAIAGEIADSVLVNFSDFFCAYLSIEDFKEYWTIEDQNIFKKAGFKLFALELEECYTTEHQCFFQKRNIVSKKEVPL